MPQQPSKIVDLDASFDAVLAIGLAKSPRDRFASGHELAEAIASAESGNLSALLRDRAAALLAELPWGATVVQPATAIRVP